jgi:hypothetical protein
MDDVNVKYFIFFLMLFHLGVFYHAGIMIRSERLILRCMKLLFKKSYDLNGSICGEIGVQTWLCS